jgi:hypothetical protein
MYRLVVAGVVMFSACGGGGNGSRDAGGSDAPPYPQPGCGDGIASGVEQCDGSDLAGRADCQSLGYYDSAPLTCTATCELDTSRCTGSCGDGVVQPDHEYCDGADPATTCTDVGFGAGAISCSHCAPDLGDCKYFGWHRDYLPFDVTSISGTGDTNVWVTGSGGTAHWDGATWQPFTTPGACGLGYSGFGAVGAAGPGDVWLGFEGTIIHVTPTACRKYILGGPTTILVSSIVPLADDDVWLLGYNTVWHFDGQAWTSHALVLEAMWVAGHDDVWGVDASNIIHHFDGSTWTTTTLAEQRALHTIWGTGPNDIYAGGRSDAASQYDTAVIEHYDGTTWSELTLDLPIDPFDSVTSVAGAEQHLFVGLHNTSAVRVREGNGWTQLAAPELRAQTRIYASPTGHMFVVPLSFPEVLRYEGTDQRDVSMGVPSSIAPVSASEIYAITSPSTADRHLYSFDGTFWREDTSVRFVRSVTTALSGDVLLLASDGLHTRTGSTWSAATPGITDGDLMWAASPTDVWVRDLAFHLHHWDGTTDTVCSSCTFTVGQVWGASATDLYAIDYPDTFKHWDGTTWSDAQAAATVHPHALIGWASNDIVALDDSGATWHFDGTTWAPVPFPYPAIRPRQLWGTSSHDIFVADDGPDAFHYDGVRWSPVNLPTAYWIRAIAGAGDTTIFFDSGAPAHHLVRTHPWQ